MLEFPFTFSANGGEGWLSPLAIAVLRKTNNAEFAAAEFFQASISNEDTRRAYGWIVSRFLIWCDAGRLGQ